MVEMDWAEAEEAAKYPKAAVARAISPQGIFMASI
jgi:hypothetical protein